MSPDCLESLFLPQNNKVVKADTAGYHAYCQSKYCFRFPVTTLSFFDLDCGIDHMCQIEPVDKFIYKESSTRGASCKSIEEITFAVIPTKPVLEGLNLGSLILMRHALPVRNNQSPAAESGSITFNPDALCILGYLIWVHLTISSF